MNSASKKTGKNESGGHHFDLPRSTFFAPKPSRTASSTVQLAQPGKEEIARIMSSFELFCQLPFDLLVAIAAAATVRYYQRGEFIWKCGEVVRDIVLLETGFVKLARRDQTGTSKTYGLYGPGDSIGLFAMCAGMKHSVDAVALNEGLRTICIDAQTFLEFTESSTTLSDNLRDQLTRFSESLIGKIEVISAGEISKRLAVLMTQLVERYGVDRRNNQARLPFKPTLELMSEIVDARIETVARVLSQWKRKGWLSADAKGFVFYHWDQFAPNTTHC